MLHNPPHHFLHEGNAADLQAVLARNIFGRRLHAFPSLVQFDDIDSTGGGTAGDSDQSLLPAMAFGRHPLLIPRLKAGSNITITQHADEFEIASTSSGASGDSDQTVLPGRSFGLRDSFFPPPPNDLQSILAVRTALTPFPSLFRYVVGPASATDNYVPVYDGTTGKLIKVPAHGDVTRGTSSTPVADLPFADQTLDLGSAVKRLRDVHVGRDLFKQAGTSTVYAKCGGPLYQSITDVATVDATEKDLWSQTIAADVVNTNLEALHFYFAGEITFDVAKTMRLQVYFAGTTIFDSTAQVLAANTGYAIKGDIVRESNTVARCHVELQTATGTLFTFQNYTRITASLTFNAAEILKITGTVSGSGGTNIAFRMGRIYWEPAI